MDKNLNIAKCIYIIVVTMKIKVWEMLPLETRILFKEELRKGLFSNVEAISKRLRLHKNTVNNWKRGKLRPSIHQLKMLGIDIKDLWDEIEEIGIEGSVHRLKLPKEIETQQIAWSVGVNEGDGVGRNSIGVVNQERNLIQRFLSEISKLNINKNNVRVSIFTTDDIEIDNKEVSEWLDIPENRISIHKTTGKINLPIFKVFVPSPILSHLFEKLKEKIKRLETDTITLRRFVEGMMDAEGTVSPRKCIEISQKNTERGRELMKTISKILKVLQIEHSTCGPNSKNMIVIRISGGNKNEENLRKFKELIGFTHPQKKEKLDQILFEIENKNPTPPAANKAQATV
jgi:hypothetical protein